jgi:hypothetical protein
MMPASIRRMSDDGLTPIPYRSPASRIPLPQVVAAARAAKVDLVADDRGPSGPADQDRESSRTFCSRRQYSLSRIGRRKGSLLTSFDLGPALGRVNLGMADVHVHP